MEQVKNSQAMPLWERQTKSRGHKSSVEGALKAHRQRNQARQDRVNERLNMVKSMSTQFFPQQQAQPGAINNMQPIQTSPVQNAPINNAPLEASQIQAQVMEMQKVDTFNPMEMDEIYAEAQFAPSTSNAMSIVQAEIANPTAPEEGPIEDMPKGSYVDYTV